MRRGAIVDGGVILVLATLLGWALSRATTRVENWFVMTDELYYERLAISVAHTGSLLPRLHGELVANVNQLYPLLISTVYGDGDVAASLGAAHRLNAFVIVSAAVPVFLLARVAGCGRIGSIWAGALAVAVPWVVFASFLLTEVVAYPAFCWALLAITWAVARGSVSADLLALAAIGVAVLARVQFAVLGVVFVVAVAGELLLKAAADGSRGRELVRTAAFAFARRRVLLVAVVAALLVVAGAAVTDDTSRVLGSYSVTAEGVRIDVGLLQLAAEHVAVLALGLAIVPFLLGVAWLVDRLRPSALPAERAFAVVGAAALLLLILEVASFDQRFGAGQVKDRYLFYAVPVVLVSLAGAAGRGVWPRWWTFLVPAVPAAAGFATVSLVAYEKLNVDSPLAMLNDELLRLATSPGWARALLVLSLLVGLQLLFVGASLLPRGAVAVGAAVLATVVLPAESVYAFERLFRVNGTNGLPVTLDQGGVFGWIDRAVGPTGRVTAARYPVNSPDYWAGVGYWWDVEFWNESVVDWFGLDPRAGQEPWVGRFDRRTGRDVTPGETEFLLFHETDVRFRLAGRQVAFDRGAWVFAPERPWRAAWVTEGIYADGWTRPHTPAVIRVYADPQQRRPQRRFLTIEVTSPSHDEPRPFSVTSNLERQQGTIAPEAAVRRLVTVCVPPRGSAEVVVETPSVSAVYRDPTKGALTGETDRPAGILLRTIALADETEPLPRCPVVPDRALALAPDQGG